MKPLTWNQVLTIIISAISIIIAILGIVLMGCETANAHVGDSGFAISTRFKSTKTPEVTEVYVAVLFNPEVMDTIAVKDWIRDDIIAWNQHVTPYLIDRWEKWINENPPNAKKVVHVKVFDREFTFQEFKRWLFPDRRS